MKTPISPLTKGCAVEIVVCDDDGVETSLIYGELIGAFNRSHLEVRLNDRPFKVIVDRRFVRRARVQGDAP